MSKRRRVRKKKRKNLAYGAVAVAFILLCFLTYFSLQQSNQTSDHKATPPPVQAAIVDHLNFTGQPDPTFVNACETILNESGLTWKYYRGENVTVDFYRNLPSYGSSLIILRVHSAIMKVNGQIILPPIIGLFTSEPCTGETVNKYPDDVQHKRLVNATLPTRAGGYFGIVPKFVKESMIGEFKDTVVIMMGCEGLGYIINASTGERGAYTDMAEAFINKGAKVYIAWDGPVGVNHTDQATLCLLQSLIENRTIKEAVEGVDADPDYKSVLKFYPDGAGNYFIPNLRSSLTMNVAYTLPIPKTLKRKKSGT